MFRKSNHSTEETAPTAEATAAQQDEALFRSIEKKKKKKRRKVIRTVVIILLLLSAGLFFGVSFLRRKVTAQVLASNDDYIAYEATVGSISTTVSGSGTLANVDEETVTVPEGVEIEEVVVSADDKIKKGDVIAKLDMASVMSAMASVQSELDALDTEITTASTDAVDTYISSGVAGRVKKIYAQKGDSVLACMYENGALALLSLDGYMAVDIRCDTLAAGDSVTVIRGDEKQTQLSGIVDTVTTGTAVILVTDNGPELDEAVTVLGEDGTTLGTGKLYVHSPLKATGISGTVSYVNVTENTNVYSGSMLFYLADTSFSANYESLIKQRGEKEEELIELMQLHRNGALLSPMDGSVSSVDYDDGTESSSAGSSSGSYSAASSSTASGTAEEGEISIVTLSPDISMELTISVDESHILSLAVGQTAEITVSSISDETFSGTVTEISKTATSSSGVTRYSAVITLGKDEKMLSGMSAKAVVRIQGVDNAVIIPVDALHQTSSTSYVYTSYDAETKQPGGMVQVVAGISNSSYVEITEGLREGDTVWYTESQSSFFGFGGMGGMGGMNMNQGGRTGYGNMPSGEMPGNFGGNGRTGNSGRTGNNGGGMPGGMSGGMPGGRG